MHFLDWFAWQTEDAREMISKSGWYANSLGIVENSPSFRSLFVSPLDKSTVEHSFSSLSLWFHQFANQNRRVCVCVSSISFNLIWFLSSRNPPQPSAATTIAIAQVLTHIHTNRNCYWWQIFIFSPLKVQQTHIRTITLLFGRWLFLSLSFATVSFHSANNLITNLVFVLVSLRCFYHSHKLKIATNNWQSHTHSTMMMMLLFSFFLSFFRPTFNQQKNTAANRNDHFSEHTHFSMIFIVLNLLHVALKNENNLDKICIWKKIILYLCRTW